MLFFIIIISFLRKQAVFLKLKTSSKLIIECIKGGKFIYIYIYIYIYIQMTLSNTVL